ncbi:BQ5605_C006g03752 [Microbotryum silenes-dioicae]|uniref:BQ5605_C006g03752 protein n=1 Tax=Microbotryum silenes-dioicae TaxID=796604 RepID=A0A2X0P7J1_9BASI|nr:BQ5605_C006g03752 [Microbotryum silenes-dioicae]
MDPGAILEKDFVIQTSSVRSAIGFVCKYCGSGRLRRSGAIKHAASGKHQANVSGVGQGRGAVSAPALAKYTFLDSTDEQGVDSTELGCEQGVWEQDTYQTPSFDTEPYAASEEDSDDKHECSEIELVNSNPFDGDAGLANVQPGSDELPGDAFEPSRVETRSPPRYRRGARNSSTVPPPDHPFYPFPDPLMMIIVLFVRSLKRRVGVQELEDLLDFAAATGTTGLPAASTVRTFLDKLEKEVPLFRAIEMKKDKDRSVYVVSPRDYIASTRGAHPPAQHFARPSTARAMEHYPVLQPAHVDSAHHSRRWLSDLPPRFSAPMTRVRGVYSFVDYFVDEIFTLKGSTQYGFVESFVSFKGEVHAIVCSATVAQGSRIDVVPAAGRGIKPWPHFNPASWCLVPVTALGQPVHDIGPKGSLARINIRSSDAVDIERPLPLFSIDRTLARGKLLLVTPLRMFLDDLAATESKRWNPMYAVSLCRAGPRMFERIRPVCPLPSLPPLHRHSTMEHLFFDPSSDSEQDQSARSTWCLAANKTVAEVLAIELPAADASLRIVITKDDPVMLSKMAPPPRPTVSSRREFRQLNLLHVAIADGYRSLAVGDDRLALDYERVWAELDVVERIQARFRRSLAWLDKLKGNAREVLTDALWTAVWDARNAPEEGPSLESLVSFLSDDWLGEFVVNYAIADIIQLARSNPELPSRRYELIPSDCLTIAIHPSATGTTLDKYCFEAWLVRISGWPCATLGAIRRHIIKHAEAIWFLPICDGSHWFLARLDIANNKWELYNSMASRTLDERVLAALGDLFRLLGLKLDANKPIMPSTPQQLDSSSCGPAVINIVENELLAYTAAFDPGRPKISRARQFQRLLGDFPS